MPISTPGSSTYTISREVPVPPSGVTNAHVRGTVTNSAQTLNAIATIPLRTTNPPCAVSIQVEAGASGNVFVTFGQNETASATLGFQIPVAPAFIRIPYREGIRNNTIQLISSVASTACQFFYEWLAENV